MSLTKRIWGIFSRRSVDNERFWPKFFSYAQSKSGQAVTPDTALQSSAVYACIRVLSETIASLPLFVYKKDKSGNKKIADDHPLYAILHDSPNAFQTSYEFIEMMIAHMLLRGNYYSFKEINGGANISSLIPLDPDRMKVTRRGVQLIYEYTDANQKIQSFTSEEIWHCHGLSLDGVTGITPITYAKEAIGLSLATEEHGSRFFSNAATPSGILSIPSRLKEDERENLKKSWQDAHSGGANAFKVAILEGGLDWKPLSMSAEDSQYLQTRQFQVEEIARIFRVPAILIGYSDKASTYASAEQFMLSFVVHTLRPWLVRIEKSINKHLLSEKDQRKFFAEFQIAGLLRGDMQSRYESYAVARQWGWLSVNDIRELENLNSIGEDGDHYLEPLNMKETGTEPGSLDPTKGGADNGSIDKGAE